MTATPSGLVPAEMIAFTLSLYVKFHYGGWIHKETLRASGPPQVPGGRVISAHC